MAYVEGRGWGEAWGGHGYGGAAELRGERCTHPPPQLRRLVLSLELGLGCGASFTPGMGAVLHSLLGWVRGRAGMASLIAAQRSPPALGRFCKVQFRLVHMQHEHGGGASPWVADAAQPATERARHACFLHGLPQGSLGAYKGGGGRGRQPWGM